MTPEELIKANAEKGYVLVSEFVDSYLYKKKNEQGGWTYYIDMGYPEYIPTVWDTTCMPDEVLKAVYNDIFNSEKT